jgi:tetratricopeptide (TPR) repeat protein
MGAMTEERTNWDKCTDLAQKAWAAGNYATAEAMWIAALHIGEYFGDHDPRLFSTISSLANLYRKQENYKQAEHFYWRMVKIKENITHSTSLEVGHCLNFLAAIFYEQHRYEDAESIGKQVLSIYERRLGFDHPAVASLSRNLARLYRKQGKYTLAKHFADRATAIKAQASAAPAAPQEGKQQ